MSLVFRRDPLSLSLNLSSRSSETNHREVHRETERNTTKFHSLHVRVFLCRCIIVLQVFLCCFGTECFSTTCIIFYGRSGSCATCRPIEIDCFRAMRYVFSLCSWIYLSALYLTEWAPRAATPRRDEATTHFLASSRRRKI